MEKEERELSPEEEMRIRSEQIKEEKQEAIRKDEVPMIKSCQDLSEETYTPPNFDEMIRLATKIPSTIKRYESKINALLNKQDVIDQAKKQIEDNIRKEVLEAKEEYSVEIAVDKRSMTKEEKAAYQPTYKKEYKDKFTNDKSREVEISIRLQSNDEYRELKEAKHLAMTKTKEAGIEIQESKGKMRSMELIVELMKLKLRVL